jgi:hypothetical protein
MGGSGYGIVDVSSVCGLGKWDRGTAVYPRNTLIC